MIINQHFLSSTLSKQFNFLFFQNSGRAFFHSRRLPFRYVFQEVSADNRCRNCISFGRFESCLLLCTHWSTKGKIGGPCLSTVCLLIKLILLATALSSSVCLGRFQLTRMLLPKSSNLSKWWTGVEYSDLQNKTFPAANVIFFLMQR